MSGAKLLPIAGANKSETIRNALMVKLCLEQGKTLDNAIKAVNDSFSPIGCFSHEDGFKRNSCVALINGSVVVFAQLDGPKNPLKPSTWSGSTVVRLKTTAMTDAEKESIVPVTGFIRNMLSKPFSNSRSEIHVTSSSGSSSQSARSAVSVDELQAIIAATFADKKKKR